MATTWNRCERELRNMLDTVRELSDGIDAMIAEPSVEHANELNGVYLNLKIAIDPDEKSNFEKTLDRIDELYPVP